MRNYNENNNNSNKIKQILDFSLMFRIKNINESQEDTKGQT